MKDKEATLNEFY